MARSKLPVFHIDRQFAVSLLGPIEDTLDELTARLHQYGERMPLSDADRGAIADAEAAVVKAAETVRELLASRRDAING